MLGYGAHDKRLGFAYACVFLAGVAEVFPSSVAGANDPAGLDCDTLVDNEFAEGDAPSGFPVVVISAGFSDDLVHFALAGRRGVADRVRDLVCKPEWNKLWLEAERTRIGVGLAGKMFEGDERHSAATDYKLAGICGSNADHENDVGIDICVEDTTALGLSQACERDDIDTREHGAEVIAVGVGGGANHFLEVGTFGIKYVIGPVGFQYSAVRFEISQVCGDAIGAVDYSKKIWEQVDQHRRQENTAFGNAQQESTVNCSNIRAPEVCPADSPAVVLTGKSASWHRNSHMPMQEAIEDPMTALRKIELRCPSCSHEFPSQTVVSTNWFGGKRTDFHERAAGAQPWAYQVHMCDRCGYSGAERDFSGQTDISPLVRERVWSELSPMANSVATGSEKYEAAAKVAEWQGADRRYIGDLWLRAAWCCVDEGDVEAERYFRRLAAWSLEQALEFYDVVDRDDRAVLVYLVGELWRRIGDLTQANAWFDLVPDEVTDPVAQRWIIEQARRQQTDPREWFA
jgi:uncharacterized protein (DUF2225 family)